MKLLNYLTVIYKYVAIAVLMFLMFFITYGVISRLWFTPLKGDIELVQLGMVVLIMFGFLYTESIDGHISIGLIVDRFPEKYQTFLNIISHLLKFVITLVVAIVFLNLVMDHFTGTRKLTDLMRIPYYPFEFMIFLGFLGWSLMSLTKAIVTIQSVFTKENREEDMKSV